MLRDQRGRELGFFLGVWSETGTGAPGSRRRRRGRLRPAPASLAGDGQEVGLVGRPELGRAIDVVDAQLLAHHVALFFRLSYPDSLWRALLRELVLVFHPGEGRVPAVGRAGPSAAGQTQQVAAGLFLPQVVGRAEAVPHRNLPDEQRERDRESVAPDGLLEALFLCLVSGGYLLLVLVEVAVENVAPGPRDFCGESQRLETGALGGRFGEDLGEVSVAQVLLSFGDVLSQRLPDRLHSPAVLLRQIGVRPGRGLRSSAVSRRARRSRLCRRPLLLSAGCRPLRGGTWPPRGTPGRLGRSRLVFRRE